ncbi:hypothetical protein AN958_09300, partial [Leucoagaricus sp. SymC.cos]
QEVRMDDYIQSYMTTGRPPQPVPPLPTGDKERAALGLPPLFKPISEYDPVLAGRPKESIVLGRGPNGLTSGSGGTRKINPADIPTIQDFKTEKHGGETFYTICCSETYSFFSPEELRYYAYQKGHKHPPTDEMQSITARPEFSQHSFEELRVVHMLAGRELTSAEIFAAIQPQPAAPRVPFN